MPDRTGRPRLALSGALTALLALVLGWWLAGTQQPSGFSATRMSMSTLAAQGAGSRWLMTCSFVVTGVALLVTAWSLPRLALPGRIALALSGVATGSLAAIPLRDPTEPRTAHTVVAFLALVLLASWPCAMERGRVLHRAYAAGALAAVAGLGLALSGFWGLPFGTVERVVTTMLLLWLAGTAVHAWWLAGHRLASRPVAQVLQVGVIAVVCAMAGVATTAVVPVQAETRHYAARVSLDPNPMASSTLVASTIFGDVEVGFRGLAPGIRATPQVKASITELLGRPQLSISTLAPGPLELDRAVRDAGLALGMRFLVGSALVAALVVASSALRRRGWPPVGLALRSLAAVLLAGTVTGAAAINTYRAEDATGFTSTGVLSTVQTNATLLADVEARSAQVAPYLTNLVALTTALQDRYAPTSLDEPVALRLLLISDLHGANQYPLAREIIEQDEIDAVVDTGDLVTFGTVAEADASGLFTGIESLGVPYLFVRGNHDATSATDSALLDRLAQVPNVILLQRDPETFVDADLNGIHIRGVNDTRWFGDDGKRTAAAQLPAIEAHEAAFAGQPEADLLVTHHPAAARAIPAGVSVHGHMHSPFLEGNRIQVGTFTGGGPFSHYVTTEDGAELSGQPMTFDLLEFGEDCRVTSLTRFRFRDVIEGRPAYEDVTLINGSVIDRRPPLEEAVSSDASDGSEGSDASAGSDAAGSEDRDDGANVETAPRQCTRGGTPRLETFRATGRADAALPHERSVGPRAMLR